MMLVWFRDNLPPAAATMPEDKQRELVEEYLARHDNEIAVIRESIRPGRPKPTRLDLLETVRRRENAAFDDGTLGAPTGDGAGCSTRWMLTTGLRMLGGK